MLRKFKMNKGFFKISFILILLASLVFLFYFLYPREVRASPGYPNPMGIEYNSTSGVYHIWNEKDDYWLDEGGFQITNHYQEYWTHNLICIRIVTVKGDEKTFCSDGLTWIWIINSDNSTYANLTGSTTIYENIKGEKVSVNVTLEYYLENDWNKIRITPIFENTGDSINNSELKIHVHDIKVGNSYDNNWLLIHLVNTTEIWNISNSSLDLSFNQSNLDERRFEIYYEAETQPKHAKRIIFMWNESKWINDVQSDMNYSLEIKHDSEFNAPINLTLKFGALNENDILTTILWWRDPAPPTDCDKCLWISDGGDYIRRVDLDDPTTSLESWYTGTSYPMGIEYYDGWIYYTDTGTELIYKMYQNGTFVQSWSTAGGSSGDAYGLCHNNTHFFIADKADDDMYITTIADPGTLVSSFVISPDTEGCFWRESDNRIYTVNSKADEFNNYTITGTTGTSWSLNDSIGAPTAIVWADDYWWISDDGDNLLYKLSQSDLEGGTYTASYDTPATDDQGLAYTFPAQFSDPAINVTEVFENEPVNHTINISNYPNGYFFSWNGTDGCTGGWQNSSWIDVSGSSTIAWNVSTPTTGCAGKKVAWRFYANNSAGLRVSDEQYYDVYKYGVLEVDWTTGSEINDTDCTEGSPCEFNLYDFFTANATVTCAGGTGAKCGKVSGGIRYNVSTDPDTLINATEGATPLYLKGWQKKKPINISVSSGSTEKDYQVPINVTYDDDMQPDFDDLRFVNGSENVELDYWIENKSDSEWAYVWVKVDQNITTENYTIYVYYNNPDVSTTSNGENTFLFFEDFDAGLGKWTNFGDPSPETFQNSGFHDNWGYSTKGDSTYPSGSYSSRYSNQLIDISKGIIIESRHKEGDGLTDDWQYMTLGIGKLQSGYNDGDVSPSTIGEVYFDYITSGADYPEDYQKVIQYHHHSYDNPGPTYCLNESNDFQWHRYTIKYNPSTTNATYYQDGTFKCTNSSGARPYDTLPIILGGRDHADQQFLDWVLARKYADPEPTYDFGAEEDANNQVPSNPQLLGILNNGDSVQVNFTINGTQERTSKIDINFSSSYGSSNVPNNDTADVIVRIVIPAVDTSFKLEMLNSGCTLVNYSSGASPPGTSTTDIEFNFTWVPEYDVEPCIVGSAGCCQNSTYPIWKFYNTGNTNEDWWIQLNESVTGIAITFNNNTYIPNTFLFKDTGWNLIGPNIAQGGTKNCWLWANVAAGTSADTYGREFEHNATEA